MKTPTSLYIRRLLLAAPLAVLLLALQSCIKENLDECEEEAQLFITVVDLLSGLDITDTEEVGDVDLFIFDPAESFVDHITVPKEKLIAGDPIAIKHTDVRGLWVSAWGNLKDGQIVPFLDGNCTLTAGSITVKDGSDGYHLCPDDLFFGVKQVNLGQMGSRAVTIIREELPISRKNARMHLTVLGLPKEANEADYYFTVQGGYAGYNFKGEPVAGENQIRQTGIFNQRREYATEDAFNIIHCLEGDNNITVNLYREAGVTRAPSLIASVNEDDQGVYIAPLAGQTTNVLIDLRGADIAVQIRQTPWNEVYNWMTW